MSEGHDKLLLQIGEVSGKTEIMRDEIKEIKDDVKDVYNRLNDNTQILVRIEQNTIAAKRDAVSAREQVEDLINQPTTDHQAKAVEKTKAWNKPIGELMGDIFIKAISVVGVGIVVALILYGVGVGNFP